MEKGKGKCIVCGNDSFAKGEIVATVIAEDIKDIDYFNRMTAHACKNCGFIQLTSKKVLEA